MRAQQEGFVGEEDAAAASSGDVDGSSTLSRYHLAEAAFKEGVLESRAPGVMGKWTRGHFQLQGGLLARCDHNDIGGGLAVIPLGSIGGLTLASESHEFRFVVEGGGMMRFRALSEDEALSWFAALEAGQALTSPAFVDEDVSSEQEDVELDMQLLGATQPGAYGVRKRQLESRRRLEPRNLAGEGYLWSHSYAGFDHPSACSTGGSPAPRLEELHALHKEKMYKRDLLRLRQEAEELERLENRRVAAQAAIARNGEEWRRLAGQSLVPLDPLQRQPVWGALHDLHAQRLRKQGLLEEQREKEEMAQMAQLKSISARRRASPDNRRRVMGVPTSPTAPSEDVRSEGDTSSQQHTESVRSTAASSSGASQPTNTADCLLAAVLTAVQLRCGGSRQLATLERKRLLAPLKSAVAEYEIAYGHCKHSTGYKVLESRPCERCFPDGQLLPEPWPHSTEPSPIRQVTEDLAELLESAQAAQDALLEAVAACQRGEWPAGQVVRKPSGIPMALFAYNPGLKSCEAAELKALIRFGPGTGVRRYRHLLDLARVSVVFASCDLLSSALDQILKGKDFSVLEVRNLFARPAPIGARCVELSVAVAVNLPGRDASRTKAHVCELRLEETSFFNAHSAVEAHLSIFYSQLMSVLDCPPSPTVQYIARTALFTPAASHHIRALRRHLTRRFGSTVCGWRRSLASGSSRLASFSSLRDTCQMLRCVEHTSVYWTRLAPGPGGCISLFEIDPEAVVLLGKLLSRLLTISGYSSKVEPQRLFTCLWQLVRPTPKRQGHLQAHEFRIAARALGVSQDQADRAFTLLDSNGGNNFNPPATITVSDMAWLRKLPLLVDLNAVVLTTEDGVAAEAPAGPSLQASVPPVLDSPSLSYVQLRSPSSQDDSDDGARSRISTLRSLCKPPAAQEGDAIQLLFNVPLSSVDEEAFKGELHDCFCQLGASKAMLARVSTSLRSTAGDGTLSETRGLPSVLAALRHLPLGDVNVMGFQAEGTGSSRRDAQPECPEETSHEEAWPWPKVQVDNDGTASSGSAGAAGVQSSPCNQLSAVQEEVDDEVSAEVSRSPMVFLGTIKGKGKGASVAPKGAGCSPLSRHESIGSGILSARGYMSPAPMFSHGYKKGDGKGPPAGSPAKPTAQQSPAARSSPALRPSRLEVQSPDCAAGPFVVD